MQAHISTQVGQPRAGEQTPHVFKQKAKYTRKHLGLREGASSPSDPGSLSVEKWKLRKQKNGK